MKWQGLLAAFLLLASGVFARAQVIQISAQTARSTFLLYERVDVLITVANISGNDIELSNDEGQPWLSFQVMGEKFRDNFLPVHTERQSSFAPMELKAGQTKTFDVNITPLYSFRSEGNYRVSAMINLPGAGEIVSDPVSFAVQRGRTVVSDIRSVDSLERVYSLVRFSPSAESTGLYLRVAAPSENIIYANYSLGDLVSSVDPHMLFDPQGNVHILQPTALGTYLYTRTDPDGKVLGQRLFKTIQWQPGPHLVKLDDGSITVQGGISEDTTPRARLSDSQPGDKIAAPIAPANNPAPSDTSVPPSSGP
jgi:hypothetical protein